MLLSWCAFACMIKMVNFYDDFILMVDETSILADSYLDLSPEEQELKLAEEIQSNDTYKLVFPRWEASSRMRTWLIEKWKNLAEKIKREEEDKTKDDEEKPEED